MSIRSASNAVRQGTGIPSSVRRKPNYDAVRHNIAKISEAQFQKSVIQCAKAYGWRVHAERPGRFSDGRWATMIQGDKGFPDLVMVRGQRLLFAELKVGKNKLSDEQCQWIIDLTNLMSMEVAVYSWTPKDWPDILKVLMR